MLRSKYIPSNTSVVLIDYSNYDPFQNCTNTEGDFLNFLVQILSSIENNETEYYLIRLYGGWHENGVLTNLGSKLQQLISSVKIFPTNRKGKVVRGEIELASSLNSMDGVQFNSTFRTRIGIPRIQLDKTHLSQHCTLSDGSCPARLLERFTKNRNRECHVGGCSVIHQDAFKRAEQKMVDTMIAVDLVDYSEHENILSIHLFSDDMDLIPPVIRSLTKKPTKVITSRSSTISGYNYFEQLIGQTIVT